VRIREVVLPAVDPAVPTAFHPGRYGSTRVRFEPGVDVSSHLAVNVPPDRFDEAVAWVREQTELVQEDVPFPLWRARSAYYYDSAGNIIELIARERVPGDELLIEVSEVGLPVADVGAVGNFLETELGLPHFSGDRENFSAVGDDHGLFILVPVGRPWLFTDRPTGDAAVRVTIEAPPGQPARELVVPGSSHVIEIASD
jgi:hypothetical protein